MKSRSAADVEGPWVDPGIETGLIDRCRRHWNTPIDELSNGMLATFLRQKIAIRLVIPEATKRLQSGVVDGTELYDDELREALARHTLT